MTFDETIAGGEMLLQQSIQNEAQETLQLDFKASAAGKPGSLFADGRLTKEGRRAIGKALSAFSNSAGGLIIIGVDCRAVADGADIARALDPISNWKAALSAVNSAAGDLLQPKNDAVRVDGFGSADDDSAGYLVIDVPRSERRPHMCNMTKQYFKRSGSASYTMEHFDVEDAFRRASSPDLALRTTLRRITPRGGQQAQYQIEFWFENIGEATAFYPSLHLRYETSISIGWPSHVLGVHREAVLDGQMSFGNSEFVIHPGQTRLFERLEFSAQLDKGTDIPIWIGGEVIARANLMVEYRIFAKDMVRKVGQFSMHPADFYAIQFTSARL